MKSPIKSAAILAAAITGLITAPAQAQNPNYAPGDLVLGFQNPGGTTGGNQVVLVNLGNTATVFRDATSNLINITNIGSLLSGTFGANWASETSLYMSAVGIWGTNTLSNTLTNGDPHRTLYLGRARDVLGTAGTAGSSAPGVANTSDATGASTAAFSVGNSLEQNSALGAAALNVSQTSFDEQNPFINLAAGQQGIAYTKFAGGLQDRFELGPQFADFGGIGPVESVLDLYRMQTRNNIAGQYDQGGTILAGLYQGSLVLDALGNVSYMIQPLAAVPEPATFAFGLAMLGVCGTRRFRARKALAIA
jgi:PEP-CTERM motif